MKAEQLPPVPLPEQAAAARSDEARRRSESLTLRTIFRGLRFRLLLLVLLAGVPPVVMLVDHAMSTRRTAIDEARRDLEQVAKHVTEELKRTSDATHNMLSLLAQTPAIAYFELPACRDLLRKVHQQSHFYTNLISIGQDGVTVCSGTRESEGIDYSDRAYFARVKATLQPVVSPPIIGRASGRPSMPVVYPMLSPRGEFRGALVGGVDLAQIAQNVVDTDVHRSMLLVLWGSDGKILYRYPDGGDWVGKQFPETDLVRQVLGAEQRKTIEAPGVDGVLRVHAVAPLKPALGTDLWVSVGIDRDVITAAGDRALRRDLLLLALVGTLAALAALLVSERGILRVIAQLARTSRRIASGDLGARTGIGQGFGELGSLAADFDTMATSMERMLEEVRKGEEAARRANRALKTLGSCNQVLVRAESEAALLAGTCNHVVDIGGYTMAWVGYADERSERILPVAHTGDEDGYLEALSVIIDERSRAPSVRAVLGGAPVVVADVGTDPDFEPWRDLALARGYRSIVALPLIADGRTFGVFAIYAGEARAFEREEVELLSKLAEDLAYGIASLRARAERDRAERELRSLNRDLEQRIHERTAELEASKNEIEDLYEHAPCGYHSLDADGFYLRINETELSWIGLRREDVIGKLRFTDVLTAESVRTFHEHFPVFKQTGRVQDTEFDIVRRDGSLITVSLSATAVRDADGNFLMSRSTTFDVTASRRAAAELSRASAHDAAHTQALTLFNSAADLNGLVGATLQLLAERYPYPVSAYYEYEGLGGQLRFAVGHGAAARTTRVFRLNEGLPGEAASTRRTRIVQFNEDPARLVIDTGFGAVTPRALIYCPVSFQDRLLGLLVLASDAVPDTQDRAFLERLAAQLGIAVNNLRQVEGLKLLTEELRARSEEIAQKNLQLQEASRLKSEFLASMSHELRTPLNAIIGFSEVLRDGLAGDMTEEQREHVGEILASGEHLLELINDLLDLSKIEAGRMTLDLQPSDAQDVAERSVDVVRDAAAGKSITIEVDIESPMPTLLLDPRKTRQILYNLLSNAVKFTTEGGRVTLTVRRVSRSAFEAVRTGPGVRVLAAHEAPHAEYLQIAVQDTGIGMAPDALAGLFEPFVQLDSSLSRRYQGTGLGLAMVWQLAQLFGGGVAVSSEPGKGSCFSVWLPWREATDHADAGAADEVPAIAPLDDGEARQVHADASVVIVVEDQADEAGGARSHLEAEGFIVLSVSTAEEAIELAQHQRPSAIVLDILLPGADSWSMLARLKEHPGTRDIPVVVASVSNDPPRAYALGATEVLLKPVSREALTAALRATRLESRSEGGNVLVVDDDPQAVRVLSLYLADAGYRPTAAFGGREALESLRREPPDLILLDLMMPDVSGLEVLDALKAQPAWRNIPVVILTAKQLDASERSRLEQIASRLLEKARCGPNEVVSEVRRALSLASIPQAA